MAINREKILKGAEKLVQKGKIEPAIREYEKLLKINPNDVNTINRIGDLHNRIGQVDRAVELYEKIADSFPASPPVTVAGASRLEVADNSGARKLSCIQVMGGSRRRSGGARR